MTLKSGKLVCGVGINDCGYNVRISEVVEGKKTVVWSCPFYVKWSSMLDRCYTNKFPSYEKCIVKEDWLYFSKFKAWMETQDWEGKQLDKDLLVYNNKLYSDETCLFISKEVNLFINERTKSRGDLPIGVCFDKRAGRFIARCADVISGKDRHLGHFYDKNVAHNAWLDYKLGQAMILAARQEDPRVAEALVNRYKNYKVNY